MDHTIPLCSNCRGFILTSGKNSKEKKLAEKLVKPPLPIVENGADGPVCDFIIVMLVAMV